MTKLELTFNPYKRESTLAVNGEVQPKVKARICGSDGEELSFWAADFFRRAVDEFNDNVEVTFNGIQRDYEFLEDALNLFEEHGSVIKPGRIVHPENVMGSLKQLFIGMRRNSPFEVLKTDGLKRLFDKATDSDFEMAVVATMGAGKSTLINSMLGRELLPARAEATTATIAKIHDIDGMDGFRAKAYDASGKIIEECDDLTLKDMNRINDAPGTSVVEIYGDIPGIDSKEVKLVLTDTPGPNNSRTLEHQAHTFRLLDAEWKPMIIYVLNATSLEVNDDDYLISKVASIMNQGDRQSHDRFLFVLNKADEFDPDTEPIARKLDDVRKYLKKHGIQNPRVMPASARLAKLIRQSHNADTTMTAKEKRVLAGDVDWFVAEGRIHFSDYAKFLSPATESLLQKSIDEAKAKGDNETLALLYSGVPSIEMAISEYLTKYAIPAKIAAGVETFHSKVANLRIAENTKNSIIQNAQKLAELREVIEKLESILAKKDVAQDVKKRIESLSVTHELNAALSDSGVKLSKSIRTRIGGVQGKIRADEAREIVESLMAMMPSIQGEFVVSVETALNKVLRSQAQKCVDDYRDYVEAILGRVESHEIAKFIIDPVPITVDEAIDSFVFEEDVKVGSHYEQEESDIFEGKSVRSKIADFFGWDSFLGKKALIEVDDIERQDFVEFDEYLDKTFYKSLESFETSTRTIATDWANRQTKAFKASFVGKLSELDKTIREKLEELKNALSDAKKTQGVIISNERNLKWLEDFVKNLDAVLAI